MNKITLILMLLPLAACPQPTIEPCETDDEAGDTSTETGTLENPDICEIPPELNVGGGFVFCGGQVDTTLEHLSDNDALVFHMPDYRPHDSYGYSYSAIVDGREPGPVGPDDYRQFVEAVIRYEDDNGYEKMALMGHICCPNKGWYDDYPDDFGMAASPQCQNAFGNGADFYPNAHCLPMPDGPWPHTNIDTENYTIPPTGGLCVYFCESHSDCPGYGTGHHFCDFPESLEGGIPEWESPFSDNPFVGVCRNTSYPEVPFVLGEDNVGESMVPLSLFLN